MSLDFNCSQCFKESCHGIQGPCGHSCCEECLKSSLETVNQLKCPKCRQALTCYLNDKLDVCFEGLNDSNKENSIDVFNAVFHGDLNILKSAIADDSQCLQIADKRGRLLIHLACQYGYINIVEHLVEVGIGINTKDLHYGRTPLHFASAFDRLDLVRWLIQAGADFTAKSNAEDNENLPVHQAAIHGHTEIVLFFIEQVDEGLMLAVNKKDQVPLKILSLRGEDVSNYVIQPGKQSQPYIGSSTDLYVAAQRGHLEKVKDLVAKRHDIFGRTAGVHHGMCPIHAASYMGHLNIVKFFIRKDPSLAYVRSIPRGQLPIHSAALGGRIDVVDYFLEEMGMDVNIRSTEFGRTLIHSASKNDHLNMVKYLISKGADYKAKSNVDDNEALPIHLAAYFGSLNVIKYLIEEIDPELSYSKNTHGSIPLHRACLHGKLNVVRYFIVNRKVDIQKKSEEHGRTCLHIACAEGNDELVRFLIDHGAKVKERDNFGWTCLHDAAMNGHMGIVRHLITRSVSIIAITNEDGETAFDLAKLSGSNEVAHFLA